MTVLTRMKRFAGPSNPQKLGCLKPVLDSPPAWAFGLRAHYLILTDLCGFYVGQLDEK